MRRVGLGALMALLLLVQVVACTSRAPVAEEARLPDAPLGESIGEFTFTPAGRAPIPVYYVRGLGDPRDARVVIVMHGAQRNARDYRDAWASVAQTRHWLVLAPQFGPEDFPGVEGYNLGGMVDDDQLPRPRADWTFGYVDALFGHVVTALGSRAARFDLFGHSAGAQFVHRYVEYAAGPTLNRAIAANAGWYTLPEGRSRFPYGMKDGPAPRPAAQYLASDLTLLLGAEDVEGENLRTDAAAMRQGVTRLERGETCFAAAMSAAAEGGVPLGWTRRIVPGVAHDYRGMSLAAADVLDQR